MGSHCRYGDSMASRNKMKEFKTTKKSHIMPKIQFTYQLFFFIYESQIWLRHNILDLPSGCEREYACVQVSFSVRCLVQVFGWGTKVYVQNRLEPSSGILHCYHLTRESTLTSQDYNPSSVVYVPKPIRAI